MVEQTTTKSQDIAKTILNQLGGNCFIAMTGAHYISAIENGLSFRFKGSRTFNHLNIVLNGLDTYDLKFFKIRNVDIKDTKVIYNIYYDQLTDIFEKETGLYTSL